MPLFLMEKGGWDEIYKITMKKENVSYSIKMKRRWI